MNYGEVKALKRRLADDKLQAVIRTEHALAALAPVVYGSPDFDADPIDSSRLDGADAKLDDAVKALRTALRSAEVLRAGLRKHMKETS